MLIIIPEIADRSVSRLAKKTRDFGVSNREKGKET